VVGENRGAKSLSLRGRSSLGKLMKAQWTKKDRKEMENLFTDATCARWGQ